MNLSYLAIYKYALWIGTTGTRRRLPAFERYSMIGSDEEGDYSLNIYPVALEDDAKFQW